MNITPHLYPYHPKRAIAFHGLSSYSPVNTAFEGESVQGSGCAYGMNSLQGAMGEYIERRHFFTEVPVDVVGKIHDYNRPEVANCIYDSINQLKKIDSDPRDFDFQLVRVNNLFDISEAYLPKRFISLGKVTFEDEQYIPLMDSSGVAVHGTPERSLNSSLNEFIERQALVGSWLSTREIKRYDSKILLDVPAIRRLVEQLSAEGELHVFDLSQALPGYTIAICYFSKSHKDKVQYVIGVSADLNLKAALESALLELWQDYIYIYCYNIIGKPGASDEFLLYAGDSYHMSHFQDNDQATRHRIPYFNKAVLSNVNLSAAKVFTQNEALSAIKSLSPYVFCYQAKDVNDEFTYTRVISPDYYLHMSIHEPLNFDNAYARQLGIGGVPDNRERIPFP